MYWSSLDNKWKIHGIVDESVQFIEKVQLLRSDLWIRFVQQFKEDADFEAGWRGEYWGKMMRGACFVYEYSKNPQLYQVLTDTIEDILTAQDEFGRISSYAISHEFDGWDLWSRKYVLLGMQYFIEICTDEALKKRIVDSMCRQADYLIEKIGDPKDGKILITKATRHWRGLNSSSILEPIVRLYRLTKEQKYFDFAEYIIGCGGTDVVNIFELAYQDQLYPYQYPVTKAYEMTSCFEGLLEYYQVTGKEWYKTAIVNYANKILESDFTVIGSCGCTHELFDHSTVRQANTNMGKIMQETCVTVTMMKFFYKLNLLTGDGKFADAFEISLYNAYLGSINTEQVIEPTILKEHPDWNIEALPFDSYSPLTAGTRGNGIGGLKLMSDNHYYGCCACIGSAGLGLVPKMALVHGEGRLAVNLYLDGMVETKTPEGQSLQMITETAYPVEGKISISLKLKEAEEFGLQLRIPQWSRKFELHLYGAGHKGIESDKNMEFNVKPEKADENGYITIHRCWQDGDTVELLLDMGTEIIRPVPYGHQVLMNQVVWGANYMIPTYDEEDPKAKDHIALRRGPIMLAQENRLGYSVDEPIAYPKEMDGWAEVHVPEQKIAPYKNLLELEVVLRDGKKMHVTDYASAGKLWTEESKMAVWMLVKESV